MASTGNASVAGSPSGEVMGEDRGDGPSRPTTYDPALDSFWEEISIDFSFLDSDANSFPEDAPATAGAVNGNGYDQVPVACHDPPDHFLAGPAPYPYRDGSDIVFTPPETTSAAASSPEAVLSGAESDRSEPHRARDGIADGSKTDGTSGTLPVRSPRPLLPRPTTSTSLGSSNSWALVPKAKRRANTEAGREKIKSVRRSCACVRCRIYKESCDEGTPCSRCVHVASSARLFRQPCFREPLDGVIAFRAGNARVFKTRSEPLLRPWSDADPRVCAVTLEYPFSSPGAGRGATLAIPCRKFVPRAEDVMDEPWGCEGGEIVILEGTPYTCCDTKFAAVAMAEYIQFCRPALLDEVLSTYDDELKRLGMLEAERYALEHPDSSVSAALDIRAAAYFSRSKLVTRTSGPNALELPYFGDPRIRNSTPIKGAVPVPSMLDYQLDYLAITFMHGQMGRIVTRLKKVMFGGKDVVGGWYEVYLTTFVLLCSLETVHASQICHLALFSGQSEDKCSRVGSTSLAMIREWEYSAKVLIYHYRAVLKGMVPFAAWDDRCADDLKARCNLDHESVQHIRNTVRLVEARAEELQDASTSDLDNSAAKPWVWISQLYVDGE